MTERDPGEKPGQDSGQDPEQVPVQALEQDQGPNQSQPAGGRLGLAGRISALFIDNPVTPILILIAVLLGIVGISLVPREEEPQIPVPLVEVLVPAPGLSAQDVVETITRPVEDIVTGIEGVDHVYSRSREGQAVISARFYPGTSSDDAALRVIERIGANGERRPPGIPEPLIVARGIEDVAVVTLTVAPTPKAAERYSRADAWDVAEALRWRGDDRRALHHRRSDLQGPRDLAVLRPDLVDAADHARDPGALHLAPRR